MKKDFGIVKMKKGTVLIKNCAVKYKTFLLKTI